jgi:5'-3' exonuclease
MEITVGGYKKYLKYQIKYSDIRHILQKNNYKKINFFIDLQGICKGLYNKDNIFFELNYYINNNEPSFLLLKELGEFYNLKLLQYFKEYDPFIITFYDLGKNDQNVSINSNYKLGRSSIKNIITDDKELQLYYTIKDAYFDEIEKKFTIDNFGKVYYLRDYESDLIPYYCIINDLFDSNQPDILNVILALDKDLLQCCQFNNTIQCATRFMPSKAGTSKGIDFGIYDRYNAVSYIYKKFKPGQLFAEHIPMILAIMGDKADNIPGIKGVGPAKAISLIQNFKLPYRIPQLKQEYNKLPTIIRNNFDLIINNLKLISFEEQLARTKIF